jgi:hypothetical protein
MADEGMFEPVLMNVAVNARDALPKGGRIVIGTSGLRWMLSRPKSIRSGDPGASYASPSPIPALAWTPLR